MSPRSTSIRIPKAPPLAAYMKPKMPPARIPARKTVLDVDGSTIEVAGLAGERLVVLALRRRFG
jgi:hypothetical protein